MIVQGTGGPLKLLTSITLLPGKNSLLGMCGLSLTPAFSLRAPIMYRSFGLADAIASTIVPATALGGKPFGTLSRYFL